jgi:hypothetical protein
MSYSGTQDASPQPRRGVPHWKDLPTKQSTELLSDDGEALKIRKNDLVYIKLGGDARGVGLIKSIKKYTWGDDLLWIHWCYNKAEVGEERWPQNGNFSYLLSSHQEIHKADTVSGKVEDKKELSQGQVYITDGTTRQVQQAGSVKWLKLLLERVVKV